MRNTTFDINIHSIDTRHNATTWHVTHVLCVIMAVISALTANAQTDAQYSQYYEAKNLYNPAATGETDLLRARAGARLQWVGIDKAPISILATGDAPFKVLNKRIGAGVVLQSETMGLYNSLNALAQVSYKIRKFGGEFSIGATVGMYDQRYKGSDVYIPDGDDYHDSHDDAIPTNDIHGTALDLGAGLWYSNKKMWLGLSCTHLTNPSITLKNENTSVSGDAYTYEFEAKRTFYLMGGCNIPLDNSLIELMPSVIVKSDLVFTTGEATLRARYNRLMIFGLGYRWNDALVASVGLEMKNFYVGYSFDYSMTAVARSSYGSHEVFLGYSMKLDLSEKNKNKHKSIRIM